MHSFQLFASALIVVVFSIAFSDAQTQATCTFKLLNPVPGQVNGVNDYGTTVGQDASNYPLGFTVLSITPAHGQSSTDRLGSSFDEHRISSLQLISAQR